jgi:2-polyprenyl-3-methyl-5-hydroxy-6-metoxy-1,4-benzoquinol methylase
MSDFQVKDYWEERLNKNFNLNGVGYEGLGNSYNEVLYKIRKRIFQNLLKLLNLKDHQVEILDIGSGTGFYIDFFKENGFKKICGSDITEVAVNNLKRRYPGFNFYQLDIGEKVKIIPSSSFDIITCMDILFHVIDDKKYETALRNIFGLLKEGGNFIFSDCFLRDGEYKTQYVYMRNKDKIYSTLEKVGFDIIHTKPMFVLMNEPINTRNPLLKNIFKAIRKLTASSEKIGFIIANLLYPVELALISVLKHGPSTELMICKKPRR